MLYVLYRSRLRLWQSSYCQRCSTTTNSLSVISLSGRLFFSSGPTHSSPLTSSYRASTLYVRACKCMYVQCMYQMGITGIPPEEKPNRLLNDIHDTYRLNLCLSLWCLSKVEQDGCSPCYGYAGGKHWITKGLSIGSWWIAVLVLRDREISHVPAI